jgi:ABC-type transport system involved in multi-copper enzyme maturation permease subunit
LEPLRYLTIFTLFNIGSSQGTDNGWILNRDTIKIILSFCSLAIISSICFSIGHVVFKKKDLPL